MADAWRIEKPVPLLAPVMSMFLSDMLGLDQVVLLGLEGVISLEDDIRIHDEYCKW